MIESISSLKPAMMKFMAKKVIQISTDLRNKYFLDAFLEEVIKEQETSIEENSLDQIFRKIENSTDMLEMLYEISRQVALSRSKKLGPKIMGLLSAKLVYEERFANNTEELIFEVAEQLNDIELRDISNLIKSIKWLEKTDFGRIPHLYVSTTHDGVTHKIRDFIEVYKRNGYYQFMLHTDTIFISDSPQIISNPSLETFFGRWAIKLRNLDIIQEETLEEYEVINEIADQKHKKRNFSVLIKITFLDTLVPLINRAAGPSEKL